MIDRARLLAEALHDGITIEIAIGRGGSMRPLLCGRDVLTIAPANASALKLFDVAVVERNGLLVAHRVVRLNPVVTRGDAFSDDDGPLADASVVGRVVAFRRAGKTVWLDSPQGRLRSLWSRWSGAPRERAASVWRRLVRGARR